MDTSPVSESPSDWVVLKFGGTSVSTAERWDVIANRVRELRPEHRVWVVCSALSDVSNRLEQAIDEALSGREQTSFAWIRERHLALAREDGFRAEQLSPVLELLDELRRLLEGIRLTREASARLRARVLSFGELASTRLGEVLLARRGVEARRIDARDILTSTHRPREQDAARYLDAHVNPSRDPQRAEGVAGRAPVVLTQGFIAHTPAGHTCLLGRGGSDTSAALFAALLGAARLEIWTDVHGMFTADPRQIPAGRLIRTIGYREASELAAMGAKVLHPRCLDPVAWAGIPLEIHNTLDPGVAGTRIEAGGENDPAVMAVVCRRRVTLLSVSTLEMWGASGFLARVFRPFEELGVSVDLVATSQSAVSVTLDDVPGGRQGEAFEELVRRLQELGDVHVFHPCAVVSIVGRRIRTVLHELGPAMSVFREHDVHLVSESSEDLNLSFVVNESDAAPLVGHLHDRLFPAQGEQRDPIFGPTWEMLHAAADATAPRQAPAGAAPWWRECAARLLESAGDDDARYVYHLPTIDRQARRLREAVGDVARQLYYSMKANPHPAIVARLHARGFGMECVSAAEVAHARELLGKEAKLLFTPNFCPPEEYRIAFGYGAEVTLDGPHLLSEHDDIFRGREIAVRVDPGSGRGHHEKVRTAGAEAKFGLPLAEADAFLEECARHDVRVVGLHAHVGSGIRDADAWAEVARRLLTIRDLFPDLRWLDLGGGLGVVERPGQKPLDLPALRRSLQPLSNLVEGLALRLEPGRFLVSEAGVLLARVTQVRRKGGVQFVGVATGMNSLLRPALYGAWHGIHNLTRLDEAPSEYWHVVGPICESGDVLGRDRLLPPTRSGDVLLIENCGAYGAVMASSYNMRVPAGESTID